MKKKNPLLILLISIGVIGCISFGLWYFWRNSLLDTRPINGQALLIVSESGGCNDSPIGCTTTTFYSDGAVVRTHYFDKTKIQRPNLSAAQLTTLQSITVEPATIDNEPINCTGYVDGIDVEYEILSGPTQGTYKACVEMNSSEKPRYNAAILDFYRLVR